MKTIINLLLILSVLFVTLGAFAGLDEKVRSLQVRDSVGKSLSFGEIAGKRENTILAVVSISTGCPMIRKSFIKYERLFKKWPGKVKFIYLESSPHFKIRETLAEVKKYGSSISVYFDEAQTLTKELGFESTNQIVLIDPVKMEIVYSGAIDNSLNYYTQKAEKTEYADSALSAFFANKKIVPAKTDAFGCAITYRRGSL